MLRRIKWHDKLPPKQEGEQKDEKVPKEEDKPKIKTEEEEEAENGPVDVNRYCRLAWEVRDVVK